MDWTNINDEIFEKIAFLYAKDVYKDYNWIPTGRSWDGNNDANFEDIIAPLHYYYKGWCEAKFTNTPESSIPKSHMDSTLVSSILDGKVIFILFVTNGKITPNFMQRAMAILTPHKILVRFVEGDELSNWIMKKDEIFEKYFSNQKKYTTHSKIKIDIIDLCFLNAILSAPELTTPVSKLNVNTEYFIYLNIRTNLQTTIILNINTNSLKPIPQASFPMYELFPGYNSFLIKVVAKHPCNKDVLLTLNSEESDILTQNIFNLVIEEVYVPKIIYSNQELVLQEIFNCINANHLRNAIVQVKGKEGTGKSYLLRQLTASISDNYNQVLVIQFSEKESENASLLCKLILFINFGFLYELSDEAFSKLTNSYVCLPKNILWELREGVKNQVVALNTIDKITKIICPNNCSLIPESIVSSIPNITVIFIDDLQKISNRHSMITKHIITEFNEKSKSQIMVIFNRPSEFHDDKLEDLIKCIKLKEWELESITVSDIYSSLKKNFNEEVAKLADFFPTPVSVLHLELLIRKLNEKHILNLTREKKIVCFAKAYNETNIVNNRFAIDKIKKCNYLYIIYIIYKIETGVPICLLQEYYREKILSIEKNIRNDLLIKEKNGTYVPYHDIYIYAFMQIYFDDSFMDELNNFLKFCLSKDINNPLLFSNILSILISKENPNRHKYLDLAKNICNDYYNKSFYIASQNLALALLPNLETTSNVEFCYNDLELLYIYAQSKKYSISHISSTKYLQRIADIGSTIPLDTNQKGIIHEIHSELITNYLYSLEVDKFKNEMNYFNKNLKNNTSLSSSEHKVNAYLNYLNRNILYISLTTENKDIENIYQFAYDESVRLKRNDYQGYADMDYAKIIMINNPKRSLDLLKRALPIFQAYSKCKKREIDCKSMIIYIEYLLFKKSFDELYTLQKEAKDGGYIHVYAKITLIILTLELMNDENIDYIEKQLLKLYIDYTDLREKNRLAIFANQLLSAIYFLRNNTKEQIKYTNIQLKLIENLSNSYSKIPIHNCNVIGSSKLIWFNSHDTLNEQSFWIDPRIW